MDHLPIGIEQVAHPVVMYLRHKVFHPDKAPAACVQTGDEQAMHFAAFVKGQLVSVVSVLIDGASAQLCQLATDPEFRAQGIGSQLIETVQHDLPRHGVSRLGCEVPNMLISLFLKLGFTVQDECLNKGKEKYSYMVYTVVE